MPVCKGNFLNFLPKSCPGEALAEPWQGECGSWAARAEELGGLCQVGGMGWGPGQKKGIALEQQHRRNSGLVRAFLIGWSLNPGLLYLWVHFFTPSSGFINLAHCFSLCWQGNSPSTFGIVVCCHRLPCTLSSTPLGFWQHLSPESIEEY